MELKDAIRALDALVNEEWDVFNEYVPVDYWNAVLPSNDTLAVRCRLESLRTITIDRLVSGKVQGTEYHDLMQLFTQWADEQRSPAELRQAAGEIRNLIASLNGLAARIEDE